MILDSLPGRPISKAEYDSLADSERFTEAYEFAGHGGADGDFILQFALKLEGEYIGFDFDPFDSRWKLAGRTETFEEIATVLSEAREE